MQAGEAHRAWIGQVKEEVLEPETPICDARQHLWLDTGRTGWPYLLAGFHAETCMFESDYPVELQCWSDRIDHSFKQGPYLT